MYYLPTLWIGGSGGGRGGPVVYLSEPYGHSTRARWRKYSHRAVSPWCTSLGTVDQRVEKTHRVGKGVLFMVRVD